MKTLKIRRWLGIDIGSSREKICSFCLIESGKNGIKVRFEKGSADAAYPSQNSLEALIEPTRAPTYLKPEVEAAVTRVLTKSDLVDHWLESARNSLPSRVAIDAPVTLAIERAGPRLTESASTESFKTPGRATFEDDMKRDWKPGF